MFKSRSSAVLAIVLAMLVPISYFQLASARATTWADASPWAYEELMMADSYGLIPYALFDVDFAKPITRAEFAAVAVRLHDKYTGSQKLPDANNIFSDITDDDVDIMIAYELGLVQGVGDGLFNPDGGLTREQMATILWRTLKILVPDVENGLTGILAYSDEHLISTWALESVHCMGELGFVKGIGGGYFNPDGSATCEQAVIIAFRIFAQYAH